MSYVREIWAADADPVLIAPLTSQFPCGITVGASKSLAFSSQLDVLSPTSVYDKIDYKDLDMTGEELYDATKAEIAGGFKGGQQYTSAQVNLMIAHNELINPPEVSG